MFNRREVKQDEILKFAELNGLQYFKTSAKNYDNVEAPYHFIAEKILEEIESQKIKTK